MGLFGNKEEMQPYEAVKPSLATKDGNVHVAMLHSYSTWTTTKFHCDEDYTKEVDAVLAGMQADGYEIVNVQHNSMSNGTSVDVTTTTTLVTYR